ncbi:MAG: hypothetical protein RR053_06760 [Evtepia sp.]
MAFLVRKISQAKWPSATCELKEIPGDAISDLRTTANTLSVWEIDSTDDLDAAALALATSSKIEKIEAVNLVWFSEESLLTNSFVIDNQVPGDTVISDLSKMHKDIVGMTYDFLGLLSVIIVNAIHREQHCKRYTRASVKGLLCKAYNENRISLEKCNPKLLEEIKKFSTK